ncbi:hypothetical protein [Dethiothermospora halolimnae]|uniref:hypothetical protein n=1 Tax=Dethiothermospora halolimnae TaxID=3114390 RepID=UPI003CCBD308
MISDVPAVDFGYGVRSTFLACGREYNVIKKEDNTTKEDFIKFIIKEIQEGRPCIALGIVGPPEACVVTVYRENGKKLLRFIVNRLYLII